MQDNFVNTLTATGTGVAVGTGVTNSLKVKQSLLNASLPDMISGNFTLYVSDVVSIIGVTTGVLGIIFAVLRWRNERKHKRAIS